MPSESSVPVALDPTNAADPVVPATVAPVPDSSATNPPPPPVSRLTGATRRRMRSGARLKPANTPMTPRCRAGRMNAKRRGCRPSC